MKERIPSLVVGYWSISALANVMTLATISPDTVLGDGFEISDKKIVIVRKNILRVLFHLEYQNAIATTVASATLFQNASPFLRAQGRMDGGAGYYGGGNARIARFSAGDVLSVQAVHNDNATRSVVGTISLEEILPG